MAKTRKKATEEARPIDRKIYFYRANVGDDEAGRPLPFDPTAVLRHIDGLPFSVEGRYYLAADTSETVCLVNRIAAPQRITLASVRRSGLPQREEGGRFSPLGIPPTSGIVEPIHIVFFPDNIVGCEFNYHGPRIGRLRAYLAAKGGEHCPNITFSALLRQNAVDDLNRLRALKSFELKIHSSFAEQVSRADESLGSAFKSAREAGGAEIVHIVLRPEKRTRAAKLADGLISSARKLVKLPGIRDQATKFAVSGLDEETGLRCEIDLLSDQLIAKKKVMPSDPKTRAVAPESAFAAIEEAYDELRDQLVKVRGVSS